MKTERACWSTMDCLSFLEIDISYLSPLIEIEIETLLKEMHGNTEGGISRDICVVKDRQQEKREDDIETYRPNRLLQLLLLPRLHRRITRPIHQPRQFLLVTLDPAFQIGDIILGIAIPPIEHIPHSDQGIPLLLEILKHALVPHAGFVFEQSL